MSKELKELGIVFGVGTVVGFFTGALLMKKSQGVFDVRSPKVLNEVKERLNETQEVEGSWIHSTKETIERQGVTMEVYRGGITCKEGDSFKQFEFLADPKTGTLLDIYPI